MNLNLEKLKNYKSHWVNVAEYCNDNGIDKNNFHNLKFRYPFMFKKEKNRLYVDMGLLNYIHELRCKLYSISQDNYYKLIDDGYNSYDIAKMLANETKRHVNNWDNFIHTRLFKVVDDIPIYNVTIPDMIVEFFIITAKKLGY